MTKAPHAMVADAANREHNGNRLIVGILLGCVDWYLYELVRVVLCGVKVMGCRWVVMGLDPISCGMATTTVGNKEAKQNGFVRCNR